MQMLGVGLATKSIFPSWKNVKQGKEWDGYVRRDVQKSESEERSESNLLANTTLQTPYHGDGKDDACQVEEESNYTHAEPKVSHIGA